MDNLTHTPPPTFRTLTVSAPARLLESDAPKDRGQPDAREPFELVTIYPDGVADPAADRDPDLIRRIASDD